MKIGSIQVGVPIYRIRSTVEHSIVRMPTVFERMIMRLSRRGGEIPEVGRTSFREAFEEHLGVTGIPRLLETSVAGLLRMNVLTATTHSGGSVLDLPISALRLTPAGNDFYNRNTLPSHPTRDAAEHYYLPWLNSLESGRPSRVLSDAPPHSFDAESLRPRDPSALVRSALEEQRPRFLKQESRVVSVDAGVDETNWSLIDLDLHLAPEGYLDLRVPRSKPVQDWLARLEPSVLQRAFLDHVMRRSRKGGPRLSPEALRDATQVQLIERNDVESRSPLITMTETGLTLRLRTNPGTPQWVEDIHGGRVLEVHAPAGRHDQLDELRFSDGVPSGCRLGGELEMTWGDQVIYTDASIEARAAIAAHVWDSVGAGLDVELSGSLDPNIAVLPLLWGSARPIEALASRFGGLQLSNLLELTGAFARAAKELAPSTIQGFSAQLAQVVVSGINATASTDLIDAERAQRWFRRFEDALAPGTSTTAIRAALLSHTRRPASVHEIKAVFDLARGSRFIPHHLVTSDVVSLLLTGILDEPDLEMVMEGREALRPLVSFRLALIELDTALGRHNAVLGGTGGRVTAVRSVGQALRAGERWLKAVDDTELARAAGGELPARVAAFQCEVRNWVSAARNNLAPELPPGHEALVFDSNSLLDYPDSIQRLDPTQTAVIPNRVLRELDGLKRSSDEGTAHKARAANRTIDEVRGREHVRFEQARTALIPKDLGGDESADNQILSVAIAFSASPVTLVTNDKNLRIKAQAAGVESRPWPQIQGNAR